MARLATFADEPVDAATALARGAGAASAPGDHDAMLYGARVVGAGTPVLGRWQRGHSATPALRRASGGPTACIGDGVLYLALGLRHRSSLMACPPDRILNRNVRGLLGGLGALAGEPVLHYGREWLSQRTTPIALIGWNEDREGRVLLEAFVSIAPPAAPFAPPRGPDAYRGHAPGSIACTRTTGEMVEAIARAHGTRFGEVTIATAAAPPPEVALPADREDVAVWSDPFAVPIGIVRAGVTLSEGRLAAARVAGDFYAQEAAIDALEQSLVGLAPEPLELGAAIDRALGPGRGVIEGLRSLAPIRDALLAATARAEPPREA